ncbi:MAG TPA: SH3 domain-containing protein [Bryobacteraceae bacterium]|nr:SH3 domain-containing protein [Bryobacteraceae bacterium]
MLGLALLAAGCGGDSDIGETVIGEAWVGPVSLDLRGDIPLKSPKVATVKHGAHLEIVQQRRRFLKVRTDDGVEGWTEQGVLLSSGEMTALQELGEQAKKLRPHGLAISFDLLNVHTLPARQSPSFTQVKQGEKMEVLTYAVMPRKVPARPPLIPPAPKRPRIAKKKKAREPRYQLPPLPAPPGPPAGWIAMSRTDLPPLPPEPPVPVATDDWTLVRVPSGQVGWVLTRRLYMAIPDEVAQYAEGHRITSYFRLGEVDDGGQKKSHWLWTTTGGGLQDSHFDSFRVFIWNVARHRYETAYIERRLKGYLPVELQNVSLGSATYPGFSVCVQKEDGQRYRRSFAFIVNIVRFAGEGPCAVPPAVPTAPPPVNTNLVAAAEQPKSSDVLPVYGNIWDRMKTTARRWFSRTPSTAPASEVR